MTDSPADSPVQGSPTAGFAARSSISPLRLGFGLTVGALLALAVGQAILTVRGEFLLILVSAFIAIGLDPAVSWLVRKGIRRALAVTSIMLVFLSAVVGFGKAAIPPLVREGTELFRKGPAILNEQDNAFGRFISQYGLADRLAEMSSGKEAEGLLTAGAFVASLAFQTVIVTVLVIYFLADLAKIKVAFYRLFAAHRRPEVARLGDEIISRVGGFVLGNVITSVITFAASYAMLLVLDVPYALLLAILVGVLDLIPMIGASIAAGIVALVALATVSPTVAVVTLVYHLLVYQTFANYILAPKIMRRTVQVSPIITIVAVLIGGSLLGIIGALIAVPTAAACQLLMTEVLYPKRDAARAPQRRRLSDATRTGPPEAPESGRTPTSGEEVR